MTHQILIASYPKDFQFLRPCLLSIKKYGTGFLPPVVVVKLEDEAGATKVAEDTGAIVKTHCGQGNLGAQIVMMKGDIYCPDADITHLWGSDCLATAPFTPDQFMKDGKPVMPVSSWEWTAENHKGALPWRKGIVETLGFDCDNEYMRRIPLLYPNSLFPLVRGYIEHHHHRPFEDHVYWTGTDGTGHFSESNILGAYAEKFCPEIYHWVQSEKLFPEFAGDEMLIRGGKYPIVQFWSHGGLLLPMDTPYYTPHACTLGARPIDVIRQFVPEANV